MRNVYKVLVGKAGGKKFEEFTYLLMELNPFGGAANSAATQEFPSILWNPEGSLP
jgi:hypothetical protein